MDSFMRDTDAFSWRMEADPVLRSNIVAVAWLDRSPDGDWLRKKVDVATRLVPSFRQRVVQATGSLRRPTVGCGSRLRPGLAPTPHGRSCAPQSANSA